MERVRLSQLVHTRQASRSSSTIQKHTSNHTPRAVRMNDGEKEEALLVRSLRSTASQLWRKHQASPPVEFHTPRLRPKRASFSKRLPTPRDYLESNPRDRSDSRNIRLRPALSFAATNMPLGPSSNHLPPVLCLFRRVMQGRSPPIC